jgi:Cellulose binding domain
MNTGLRGWPPGPDQPAGARHGPAPRARHSWFSVGAVAATLLLIAGGVAALTLAGHSAPTRPVAADCGLVNCGAVPVVPAASSTATQSHLTRPLRHRTASASPAATKRPARAPSPTTAQASTPTPAPSAAPPAAPDVTVTYTPDQQQHFGAPGHQQHSGRSGGQPQFPGPPGFQGQLTIVNHGSGQVAGWTVQLTLPGDEVDFVGTQDGWGGDPFERWQFSGDTLTLAAGGSETLGPGAVLNVTVHGQGQATAPSGCTFNGAACQS